MGKDPSFLPPEMKGQDSSQEPASLGSTEGGLHLPSVSAAASEDSATSPRGRKRTDGKNGSAAKKRPVQRGRGTRSPWTKSALHIPDTSSGRREREGITLIPDALRFGDASAHRATAWSIGVVVVACALIVVPWGITRTHLLEQQTMVASLGERQRTLRERAAIAESDLELYRGVARRATALRELLKQHHTWSPFFALIESRTLPSVRYEGFSAEVTGSLSLPAAASSVRTASEQIVAWQETSAVRTIEMSGLSSTADELGVIRSTRFDLTMMLDSALFSHGTNE